MIVVGGLEIVPNECPVCESTGCFVSNFCMNKGVISASIQYACGHRFELDDQDFIQV